jgi:plastocyanin
MSGTATAPVIAGLVVGIGLVVIFAVGVTPALNTHNPMASSTERTIAVVVIPKGASIPSSGKNFEPSIIKVVIGVNNTVRWTNNDEVMSSVVASNPNEDPDFAAATEFPSGSIPANATNFLQPGQSFEFTFNKPWEIHYHSESSALSCARW